MSNRYDQLDESTGGAAAYIVLAVVFMVGFAAGATVF